MNELFNNDECIVLEIYMKKSREEVLNDLKEALPLVDDEGEDNMKEVLEGLIPKVEAMSDEEYDDLELFLVPSYIDEDGEEE